jgi:hypothetical protein
MNDKGAKKAAAKVRARNKTAKHIDPFVASFLHDGKEVREQQPYKTMDAVEIDRELVANKLGVPVVQVTAKVVDNRNDTEKKKAGVKETATERRARKKAKDAVKAEENKDRPMAPLEGGESEQTAANFPPAYKSISAEDATAKFCELDKKKEEAEKELSHLLTIHKEEKGAAESKIANIEKEVRELRLSIDPKQLDLFRHPAPAAASPESLPELDMPEITGLDIPDGEKPVAVEFWIVKNGDGTPHIEHADSLAKSNMPESMNHLPLEEYAYAVRDYLARLLNADENTIKTVWEVMAKW